MISKKDLAIIAQLRQNSRQTLTRMSRKTNIPISTLYDKIKSLSGTLIVKHTTLIDFNKLGFSTRATIVLKVEREDREKLCEYLRTCMHINSVFKINNGYDYLVEAIFRHIKDMEDFLEGVETKFRIRDKQVYYIIDEIKKESFLSDPASAEIFQIEDMQKK